MPGIKSRAGSGPGFISVVEKGFAIMSGEFSGWVDKEGGVVEGFGGGGFGGDGDGG